jgi:hypothetical protein
MRLDIWLALLDALKLIGTDVTDRHAVLCFAWSRMCVIDGRTKGGYLRFVTGDRTRDLRLYRVSAAPESRLRGPALLT